MVALVGFAWIWFAPCWLGGCAPVEDLAAYQAEGSQLLDIHGEPFARLATVNRRVVSLDSLPPHLPQAFLAVEDRRFYDHSGLDFRRLAGAMLANVRAGGVAEGGSTITQQLARNIFPEWLPYTERSVRRKVMEARVARQIEQSFSKEKILELYLNHIYLGAGAYGVEAAARTYFGKPAAELTLPEAATLAALPKAPSDLNPKESPERALERRNLVLSEMADAGFVRRERAQEAQEAPLGLSEPDPAQKMESSYFVERVRREMQQLVGSHFYTAGLKIHTTLDPAAQAAAEEELSEQLAAIESGRYGTYRHPTFSEARGDSREDGRTPYLQGAVAVMDASTGGVRALVGGRDFDDSKFDRAVQAQRQPGSAFKPFVYLTALERYGSPVHPVEDAPLRLASASGEIWEPRNYTGTYAGMMTLREALTRSKNTATVRLAQEVGIGSVIRNARRLGIEGEIPEYPATALGAAEVRPLDLVQAYAAFANGGYRVEPHFIRRIENRHGQTIWQADPNPERVIDPSTAFVLTSILQDVVERGTGTAVRAAGYRGPAAGKTGTTNDNTDAWFVGYTPDLVAGVWIGLDDPQTIVSGGTGGTLAAPVWGRIMSRVYSGRPAPSAWSPPAGVAQAEVERGTGRVVSEYCPARGPTYTEYFVGSVPAGRPCAADGRYRTAGDTLWGDEEWAGDYGDYGSLETETRGDTARQRDGIDWPDLDEMRRRVRIGSGADDPRPEPDPAARPEERSPPATPAPSTPRPRSARPEPRSAPAPEQPDGTDGPELLGVPTQGDSAPPSPRPPGADGGGR